MFIPNIDINYFRGIKKSTINDFGQYVNLFIGKNNCGKSSVLDAIYILFAGYKPQITVDINGFRDYIKLNFNDTVEVLFYKLDPENVISLKSGKDNLYQRVEISPLYLDESSVEFSAYTISTLGGVKTIDGLSIKNTVDDGLKTASYESYIRESRSTTDKKLSATLTVHDKIKLDYEVVYVSAKASLKFDIPLLEDVIEKKEVSVIVDALKLIDSRIVDVAILKDRLFVDIGFDKLMPVEILGDGVRRTINIISNLYKCRNGVLLVDEFDNGIHYSSLPTIWKAIIYTARRFNVQFFATTHNIDSLKTLKETAEAMSEATREGIRCIKLEHSEDDKLIAYNYSFPELSYAIEMEHEIR